MSDSFPALNSSSPFSAWKVHHAGVRVGNIDSAIRWYTEMLDCRLVLRWSLGSKTFSWLAVAGDDSFILELLADSSEAAGSLGGGVTGFSRSHLAFCVESVDKSVAELRLRGVSVVIEPRDVMEANRRVAFFVDPWGNLFETIQPIHS